MQRIVISFFIIALFGVCLADINLVFGGSFSRVGANKNQGLAIFNTNESAWLDLNVSPPFGTITTVEPGPSGSAWVAIQSGSQTNVYYYDGTVYHLLGYSFQGTVSHLYSAPPLLYATGSFTYYYTPDTEDDSGKFLQDFAVFDAPTNPTRSNRWRPADGQNTEENNGVPQARKGFSLPTAGLYMILSGNGRLYYNRNPPPPPEDDRKWTSSFNNVGSNFEFASVSDVFRYQNTFYAWGAFTLTGDTTVHGIISSSDGISWAPVYSNATVVSDGFRTDAVALTPSGIYYADQEGYNIYGGVRYRIAVLANGQPQGRPAQVGAGLFSSPATFLWYSQSENSIYAYFSDNTVTYYLQNPSSNLDDLVEYGRATYIAQNGFVKISLTAGQDWQTALGGGVSGGVSEVTTLGVYVYLHGSITYTYQETAFGLVGWDADEESWVPLGDPLLDVPNPIRFGNTLRSIIAVVYNEDDGSIVFGGEFATIANVTYNSIAIRDGDQFTPLGQGLSVSTADRRWEFNPGRVHAITPIDNDGNWAVGGAFDYSGDTPLRNIGTWDGSNWSPLGSGVDNPVWAIEIYNDDIIAGGAFTIAGNVYSPYVARYDTEEEAWVAMSVGTDGPVYTIYNDGGKLYIGGAFSAASGRNAYGVAVWDDGDQLWEPLDCDYCSSNCQQLDDHPLYCPSSGDVVYEIKNIPGQGLFFRINSRLYKWNGNQFEQITVSVSVSASGSNPQKLVSANDLSSEFSGSVTLANIAGGPFFLDNPKVGSVNEEGYVNYHVYGGFDSSSTINALSGSSVLKPFVALLVLLLAFLLF
eukprot:TRINITY_DN2106_c0_g12_i1.p1 TRINITY_DN2106_c0_g12~~TRINITY_DN2106_c0_g12_i1.p1  ORF type:complete len:808 (+),score=155.74 TRINITY_DN2106_c0_g12_i1:84-2507(+)